MAEEDICAVFGCENSNRNSKDLRYYELPEEKQRLTQWAKLMNRMDILKEKNPKNYKICSTHFDPACVKNNNLTDNAIPTLNIPKMAVNGSGNNVNPTDIVKFKDEPMCYEEVGPEIEDSNIKESPGDDTMVNDEDCDDEWEDMDTEDEDDVECSDEIDEENDDECSSENEDESDDEFLEEMDEECDDDEDENDSPDSYDEDAEDEQDEEQLEEKLGESPFSSMIAKLGRPKTNFQMFQKLMKRKFEGKRNSVEFKNWVLRLYFNNPELYKMFTIKLALPSAQELLSQTKIKFNTGTNKGIVTLLGRKLQKMPKYEEKKSPWLFGSATKIRKNPQYYKYCVVGIEVIDVKQNVQFDMSQDIIVGFHDINGNRSKETADKAIVMMLRGCHEVWRQVIGYGFMAENKDTNVAELNVWLDETLELLKESGFDVCAVVTSDAKTFIDLAKLKGVSAEKPSFHIGNQKILFMFDVPHLMNSTRDLFMENDFEINDGKIASWKHIEYLYNDTKSGKSILPESHVKPNDKERKQVYYAASIFNQNLAGYLHMSQNIPSAPPKMSETAAFLFSMNNTFDVLNCDTTKKRSEYNKYKRPYRGAQYQTEQLHGALKMFESAKLKTNDGATKSSDLFECWQITIKAVLELFEYYKSQKIDYILTRRLNTEPIGWFLGFVLQRVSSVGSPLMDSDSNGENDKLEKALFSAMFGAEEEDPNAVTPWKFREAYSQIALRDLMTNSLVTKSDEGYDDFLLGDKFDTTYMFGN